MTPRRLLREYRRRRTARRGQALVEMALVAPVLIALLLGGAQVAEIAYGAVSVDTSSREAARAGALNPNLSMKSAGVTWWTAGTPTHQCNAADFVEGPTGNPICIAALNARGFLSSSLFTSSPCASASQACVTITVLTDATSGSGGLSSTTVGPPALRLAGQSLCSGSTATVTGSVTGDSADAFTITDTSGDTVTVGAGGTYTLCAKATGSITSQVITATSVGATACSGYSGSVGPFPVTNGGSNVEDVPVQANVCTTTTTTTSTSTGTSTTTTSTTTTTTSTGTTTAPPATCPPPTIPDTYFIKVTVSYPVPIFVPVVGGLFQSQAGLRTVTASVTDAVEPCTLTQGA